MTNTMIFAFPGDLATNSGGYAYDRHVLFEMGKLGWSVSPLPLGAGFPFPTATTQLDAERLLSSLPDDTLVLIDGLAFGVLHEWAEREEKRLKIIALVHHPLALETGLEPADRLRLEVSERLALKAARHVIVTSPATARTLEGSYEVPSERITVAVPGTEPATRVPSRDEVPHIVSVGSLIRRKGHDVLLHALDRLRDLSWRATIAGSETLDPATATQIRALVKDLALQDRVAMTGELADVRELMATADIFALASRYEGYGMVFAEALAHGLPIVACRAGAVPEVVAHDAGILVEVDDVEAFADALRRLILDHDLRQQFGHAAAEAGARLPGWGDTARIISQKLRDVA
ncbi:glycosyltransferase family 4 protein [Rhizobium helianthi]|uniref:Glycosyltransferase family 4 protein n=1 Tax=Rhizobium helianthi TaxID=1132695 RepID=A0ABW4M2N2_9HYPH